MKARLAYRPDIDGLRALAVLPVLFFHVGIPGFEGGYVGVDVFFVISGFLITCILDAELESGKFSFYNFYERRIRRLGPAAAVVVAATAAVGSVLLLPSALRDLGQSMVAVGLFASNFLFWREAGYFDGPAELKPLLHTWSLTVEEQFYLVFPPLLLLLKNLRRRTTVLGALAVVSLLASVLMVVLDASTAFYLLPFRAWELLLGSLLALGAVSPPPGLAQATRLGLAGLVLVLLPVFVYDGSTPFPGLAALPPCLGTAMLIHAGQVEGTPSGRLLGHKSLVFIGKTSYSLYLWHWPIVVFARLLLPEGFSPVHVAAMTVASLVAGALSWRFVEQPFRDKSRIGARPLFAGAAVASLLWIGTGWVFHVSKGLPGRLSPEVLAFADAAEDFDPSAEVCGRWQDAPFCLIGEQGADPTFFHWGDSHAGMWAHAVEPAARQLGRAGFYSNEPGCPPLFGVEKDESVANAQTDARCTENNRAVRDLIERTPTLKTVLITARWAYYAHGRGTGRDAHHTVSVWDAGTAPGARPQAEVIEQALDRTLRWLRERGLRIVLLRPPPEMPRFELDRVGQSLRFANDPDGFAAAVRVSRIEADAREAVFDRVVSRFADDRELIVLDPGASFCDERTCFALDGVRPRYIDTNHLTKTTVRAHAGAVAEVL